MGARSDREEKSFGYRRLPYAWIGAMMIFASLSAAPFSLLLLGKASDASSPVPFPLALAVCTMIFLVYALGTHVGQTGYLALVTDLTPKHERSRAVTFLWMALIIGQIVSALIISLVLEEYSSFKLIQVMQSASVIFVVLAVIAIVKQDQPVELEPNNDDFSSRIWDVMSENRMKLFFGIVFVGTLGLTSQDILLEPYGGQILNMTVSETSRLTALWGAGMLVAMFIAWRAIPRLDSPLPVALVGCAIGLVGFALITTASANHSVLMFGAGASVIGVAEWVVSHLHVGNHHESGRHKDGWVICGHVGAGTNRCCRAGRVGGQ